MDARITENLNKEDLSPFHRNLLEQCKGLVGLSRSHMKSFYEQWDHNIEVYKGERAQDREDADADARGEPTKMVVPVSHAQVEALIAFCMSLYLQRQSVFELIATGEEDEKAAVIAQALLDRDLSWNKFEIVLRQFLLDIARFSLGVIKVSFVTKKRWTKKQVVVPPPVFLGQLLGGPTTRAVEAEEVEYQGNVLTNVNPYRFFPDVRMPLHRMQEGEFVAMEQWYNLPNLRQMEHDGEITGVEWVKPLTGSQWEERWASSRPNTTLWTDSSGVDALTFVGGKPSRMYVMTEVQLTLVPKDTEVDGKPLGTEDYPVKYNIWYVNDQRIVKCEPLGHDHGQYTYAVGQYAPDQQDLIGVSLCDTIDMLQQVISWFINSHITSVRKVISDRLVVDPGMVRWEDIEERRAVIRLRQDAQGQDVSKAVMQLQTVDVTSRHLDDADKLDQWVKLTTGIQHNALGQYFTGRRTAAEANSANSATAARLKAFSLVNFRAALEPMAKQMLSNLRQGLDMEQVVRVAGELLDLPGALKFLRVTNKDIVGDYDFEIFDGTIPSERANQAMALQEFLTAAMANPQVVLALGYDPKKIVEEWLTLRGIRHPKRLEMDQVRQQEIMMQMQATGLVGGQQSEQTANEETGAEGGPGASVGGPGLPMGAGAGGRPGLAQPPGLRLPGNGG